MVCYIITSSVMSMLHYCLKGHVYSLFRWSNCEHSAFTKTLKYALVVLIWQNIEYSFCLRPSDTAVFAGVWRQQKPLHGIQMQFVKPTYYNFCTPALKYHMAGCAKIFCCCGSLRKWTVLWVIAQVKCIKSLISSIMLWLCIKASVVLHITLPSILSS